MKHRRSVAVVATVAITFALVLSSIFLTLPAQAAIAFSNSWSGVKTTTTGTTLAVTVATTVGHAVVVIVATVTATVSSVVDNAAGGSSTFTSRITAVSGSTVRVSIWSTTATGAKTATSVTVTISAAARMFVGIADYSGVTWVGATASAAGSGTNPSRSQTTLDSNNWIVGGFTGSIATTPTAGTGNFRKAGSTTALDGSLIDNTVASPGSVTISETLATSTWVGASMELVSVALCSRVPTFVLPSGQTIVKWTNPPATAANVAPDSQTSGVPELVVTQKGPGPCNVGVQASAASPAGVLFKWSATSTAPGAGVNVIPVSPTAATTVCSATAEGSTCSVWLWSQLQNAAVQAGFSITLNMVTS